MGEGGDAEEAERLISDYPEAPAGAGQPPAAKRENLLTVSFFLPPEPG